ncbi:MAG: DUF1573 domain-containing protein [Muribaculum sp.]|nr:DUF1573 domain-containing protein [Muribaculum sp.]
MKLATLLFSLTLTASAAFAADVDNGDSEIVHGGRLKLKEPTLTFDNIPGDSILNTRFVIYNVGDEPVTIINIFSDCNCTVPTFTRKPIAPGDSTYIDVKYDPRGYKWGGFRRILRIRSNAVNPSLSAVISGTIARRYRR